MTPREEILANMLTFTSLRRKASQLRGAMDTLKESIAEYMTANPDDQLERDDGCAAKWTSKQNRTINAALLPSNVLVNAAAAGVLSVGVEKVGDLDDGPLKSALLEHVAIIPGEPYVDISSPSWKSEKSSKSIKREAAAPLPPTRIETERDERRPRDERSYSGNMATCPDHPTREAKESKWGGYYCTGKADTKSGYCNWKTKASA